jgi:NADPH:quinone reductase-like Zn-dependent oxidoreductase
MADAIVNTTAQELTSTVRGLTDGNGVDVVLDMVGGTLFEPALKSLRVSGRQISISSPKERRVSFDLADFYHNASRLVGVDTIKLSGETIAGILDELRPGFDGGHLRVPPPRTWPLTEAIRAYEAVANGGSPTKHVLIMPDSPAGGDR